jgi:hypothetical protein
MTHSIPIYLQGVHKDINIHNNVDNDLKVVSY